MRIINSLNARASPLSSVVYSDIMKRRRETDDVDDCTVDTSAQDGQRNTTDEDGVVGATEENQDLLTSESLIKRIFRVTNLSDIDFCQVKLECADELQDFLSFLNAHKEEVINARPVVFNTPSKGFIINDLTKDDWTLYFRDFLRNNANMRHPNLSNLNDEDIPPSNMFEIKNFRTRSRLERVRAETDNDYRNLDGVEAKQKIAAPKADELEPPEPPNTRMQISDKQYEMCVSIVDNLYTTSLGSADFESVTYMSVSGAAGTGKTTTLAFLKKIHSIKPIFLTTTNMLCEMAKKRFGVETITFFSFMMRATGINYTDLIRLVDMIGRCSPTELARLLGIVDASRTEKNDEFPLESDKFAEQLGLLVRRLHWDSSLDEEERRTKKVRWLRRRRKRIVFFLDECTQLNNNLIVFVLYLIRRLASKYNTTICVVLSGDPNQIQPINVSLSHDPSFFINISQTRFVFEDQMRIESDQAQYMKMLRSLLDNRGDMESCREILSTSLADLYDTVVRIIYPFDELDELSGGVPSADNFKASIEFAVKHMEMVLSIQKHRVLVYTNADLHLYNLILAWGFHQQGALWHVKNIERFIAFVDFVDGSGDTDYKFIDGKDEPNVRLAFILPLVRFFKYKILARFSTANGTELFRGSIVHLIAWDELKCLVYVEQYNTFNIIGQMNFTMNLTREVELFGFPMQLCFSETAFSVQGQTLTENLLIDMNKLVFNELYVLLTRAKRRNQLQNVIY